MDRVSRSVIGNHDGEARLAQINNDLLHVVNRDRINAAERFIEHEQLGLRHEASAQ